MPINFEALGVEEPEAEDHVQRLAKSLVEGKSREELLKLAGLFMRQQAEDEVEDQNASPPDMPQTPDELWDYIVARYGVRIARVAVCHDHDTPYDYICAGFFGWYPNVFGIGPRGGGKCLAEGTLIYDPQTATDRPIEDVQEGGLVGSLDADGRVVSSEVAKAFFSGEKECYEVITASGRSVVGSADHPLLTADGWARIEDLEVGGTIAAPTRLPSHGLKRVPSWDLDLLAVLLAEGNYTQPGQVSFVSYDEEIVAITTRAAEAFGGRLSPRPSGTYGLVGQGRGYRNPFRQLLDEYGCGYAKAIVKQIPPAIMAAPQDQVGRFLTIFWMCDGWIGHKGPEITLASEVMIRQIQRLLLRLGIQSRVSKTSSSYGSGTSFDCWRLVVYARFVEDFARQIPLWGDKRDKLQLIVAKTRNSNVGRPAIPAWLPGLLAQPLASMTKLERGERSRAIAHDLGWSSNKHAKGMAALTAGGVKTVQARRLRAICKHTPGIAQERVAHLLSEDLWWDAVVSIEPVGLRRTYDLTIPLTGCFVAGDILVHNSYDQALLHDLNAHFKPGCVAADTPIDCPRDHRRFPLGVPISQIQPGQLVWTFNEGEWIFQLKPVVSTWVARDNAPILKLTLDDGSVVRATSDHRFLRRDGRWAELRELEPGDSLMPLYRDWEPYVRIRPDATRGGGMVREFDAVADTRWPERKGMHVDHVDERRENSDPENLQLLTPSEHCSKTMKGRNVGRRRSKDQAERWAAMSDDERAQLGTKIGATLRESLADREITDEQREAYAEGGRKGGSRPKPQIEVTCSCGKKFWRVTGGHGRHLCPDCKTEARTCPICSETYVVPRKSRKRTCSRSCGQVLRHQEQAGIFNHKVVSIEPDGSEDVWDMEVADNHNFVSAGVVLHNCESATFGAVEGQAKRVYAAFKTFVDPDEIFGKMLMSETQYKPVEGMNYGSKVEVLGGTVAAVNSPHPQFPHSDEVEIMKADTWKESRNLAADKVTPDGRRIRGQNMATSTMKWKGGRVWQILERFKEAKAAAIARYGSNKELVDDMITKTSQFYVLVWCLFEVAEQVPNCRAAPENAHLPEWEPGLDRADCKCDCNEIVNGVLEVKDENGMPLPRTLESECEGRFYRSRGHRSRGEVIQLFLQNDQRTWAAQQLCRETETEGLYIPSFSRQRHGLSVFPLDPTNGPIYTGTDWGFTDEAAVVWIQYLMRPVEAIRYDGTKIVVPAGARVAISEYTIARKTATELGQQAILREIKLANVLSQSRIPVRRRWADLQGAGDRRDWSKMGLKTARYSTRDFGEHVKEWRGLVDADRFFVVVDEDRFTGMGCPVLCEQIEGWREEDGKESRELPQHVVSAGRYVIYGMHDIYLDSGAQSPEQLEAQRLQQGESNAPAAIPYSMATDARDELAAEDSWRARV